jgi:L-ascorbate metabolism protein UlaG (beta-lactamase superfamily)
MSVETIAQDARLHDFYRTCGDGNGLFYMGHSSILATFHGKRILFDPVILSKPYCNSWAFFPSQVIDPSVFDVDAVVVSHIHQDHYDIDYLKAVGGRAKIIAIGGRPSFINELKSQGLANLVVVEPEKLIEIFDGVSIFGVLHETNGIDASAIVFNQDFCIYHGNDNYLQPESLKKFTSVDRKIDVACIPYAYIHWYPFLMEYEAGQGEDKEVEGNRLINFYMDDCLTAIRTLNPTVVIPFGANLLLDDGDCYSIINRAVKTPVEFCEYTSLQAPDLKDIVQPMLAGDSVISGSSGPEINIKNKISSSDYRAQASQFLEERASRKISEEWAPIDRFKFIELLRQKLSHQHDFIDGIVRLDMDYLGQRLKIEIDCRTHQADWVEKFTECVPYHHFKLDSSSSGYWLNGGRFEEVIGMRRFTLKRVPNVYSKEMLRFVGTAI